MSLPEPLVPADCDLTDFKFMPLDVRRLRDSELSALESPEACWAAVQLWCASWHQIPAASLPNDDRVLSSLAGYGRVVKEWLKVKDGALRGFVLCEDGLLYHPVVAEKAIEAWHGKLKQRWATECARIKKHNQRTGAEISPPTFEAFLAAGGHRVPRDMASLSLGTDAACPDGPAAVSPQCPLGSAIQGTGKGTEKERRDPPNPPRGDLIEGDFVETFEAAWQAYPEAGRATLGKPAALVAWRDACFAVGTTDKDLLAAVKAYAASDYVTTGGRSKRFDRWLASGAFDAFLPRRQPSGGEWGGPSDLRAAVVAERGEDFAKAYLDRSRIDGEALLAWSTTAASKLRPLAALKGLRVTFVPPAQAAGAELH